MRIIIVQFLLCVLRVTGDMPGLPEAPTPGFPTSDTSIPSIEAPDFPEPDFSDTGDFEIPEISIPGEEVLQALDTCRSRIEFPEDALTAILEQNLPKSMSGVCLQACIKKETGMITSDNQFNMIKIRERLEPLQIASQEFYEKAVKDYEDCAGAGANQSDVCRAYRKMRRCVRLKRCECNEEEDDSDEYDSGQSDPPIPGMPDGSTTPNIPRLPNTPDIPNLPDITTPNLPSLPEIPEVSDPEIPGVPDFPETHSFEIPELPSFDMPELPSFDMPEMPSFDMPEMPSLEMPSWEMPSIEMPTFPSFPNIFSNEDQSVPNMPSPEEPSVPGPKTPDQNSIPNTPIAHETPMPAPSVSVGGDQQVSSTYGPTQQVPSGSVQTTVQKDVSVSPQPGTHAHPSTHTPSGQAPSTYASSGIPSGTVETTIQKDVSVSPQPGTHVHPSTHTPSGQAPSTYASSGVPSGTVQTTVQKDVSVSAQPGTNGHPSTHTPAGQVPTTYASSGKPSGTVQTTVHEDVSVSAQPGTYGHPNTHTPSGQVPTTYASSGIPSGTVQTTVQKDVSVSPHPGTYGSGGQTPRTKGPGTSVPPSGSVHVQEKVSGQIDVPQQPSTATKQGPRTNVPKPGSVHSEVNEGVSNVPSTSAPNQQVPKTGRPRPSAQTNIQVQETETVNVQHNSEPDRGPNTHPRSGGPRKHVHHNETVHRTTSEPNPGTVHHRVHGTTNTNCTNTTRHTTRRRHNSTSVNITSVDKSDVHGPQGNSSKWHCVPGVPITGKQLTKALTACKSKMDVNTEDVVAIMQHLMPQTNTGQCLLACVLKNRGVMDRHNRYNITQIKQRLEPLKLSNTRAFDRAIHVYEYCIDKQTAEPNECTAFKKMRSCVLRRSCKREHSREQMRRRTTKAQGHKNSIIRSSPM